MTAAIKYLVLILQILLQLGTVNSSSRQQFSVFSPRSTRNLKLSLNEMVSMLKSAHGTLYFTPAVNIIKKGKMISPVINQLLNTKDSITNTDLIMNFLSQDLKDTQKNWITQSNQLAHLIPILEYIADHDSIIGLNETIYPKICIKFQESELQALINIASPKVLSQFFYNSFKIRNRKSLKLLENLSNNQINTLFEQVIRSWSMEARLDMYKNFYYYIKDSKLQSLFNNLSNSVLVDVLKYALESLDQNLLDLYTLISNEKITDLMIDVFKVWTPKTIFLFSQYVLETWELHTLKFKREFWFQALSWDPLFFIHLKI